ncbi:hypothetical protein GGI20_000405 [Coemansia sp. BCRC 34301]|nr:hypothetical protein GGI20_000405 [Coemansia sp. BCRC 34301]
MQTISLFQFLPSCVVQIIVDYIAARDNILFAGVASNSEEQRLLQTPLLWVCSNFRTVVYERFCRHYGLHVAGHLDVVRGMRSSWPTCFKKLDHPTQHLASELVFFIDIGSICSGRALDMLSRPPYNGCAFPMAHTLKLFLNPPPPSVQQQREETVRANISEFVQRVKQMAPMLSKVGVSVNIYSFESSQANDWRVDSLVTCLFQVSRITYESPSMAMRITLLPGQIYNLTHINYYAIIDGSNEQILQLVRQNASTLQSLDVTLQGVADISGLIADANGTYVTYPCLHTLKAKQWMNPAISQRLSYVDAVPFPVLRHLSLGYDYPLDDDTMFRGNAATLEYLAMLVSSATASMLDKYNVFTPDSHPKLQCVKLAQMSDLIPGYFPTTVEYMQFVLGIAPLASVRELGCRSTAAELQPGLLQLGGYASIQVLALPSSQLSLWDTISLIQTLPLLSDLLTMPPCLEPIPTGISQDQLLLYVLAGYAPINCRFRCWQLGSNSSIANLETVECVLLLALACPTFGQVTPPTNCREKFMAALEDVIALDKYKSHASRLQHLVTKGWLTTNQCKK